MCVQFLRVQYDSGTERQVENDRREKGGGLGRKRASCGCVDRKFGANVTGKSKSECVCLPACLNMYVMSLANFNLILLKRTLLFVKREKHPLALDAKGAQYNLMCLDEGYELGSNDI